MPHTVQFQRVFRAPAQRVFCAFIDPDAMAKWLPPHGFTGRVHEMDARVGGVYRMSFTNLSNGQSHSFGGKFLEFRPAELLSHTDRFDAADLPGEMVTTIRFFPPRPVVWVGRSLCNCWLYWSRPKFPVDALQMAAALMSAGSGSSALRACRASASVR
jgi:uncharacterized protein YndB with AHSA1/START domain